MFGYRSLRASGISPPSVRTDICEQIHQYLVQWRLWRIQDESRTSLACFSSRKRNVIASLVEHRSMPLALTITAGTTGSRRSGLVAVQVSDIHPLLRRIGVSYGLRNESASGTFSVLGFSRAVCCEKRHFLPAIAAFCQQLPSTLSAVCFQHRMAVMFGVVPGSVVFSSQAVLFHQ